MKNLLILTILFIIPLQYIFSQISPKPIESRNKLSSPSIGTRIGLNTINEINFYFEYPLNEQRNFIGSIGYNYGNKGIRGSSLFCSKTHLINRIIKRKGVIARAGLKYNNTKSNNWEKRILGTFAHSTALDIEIDEGCFSGSNSADYEKYDLITNSIGLIHYWDTVSKNNFISFYFGLGGLLKLEKRINFIKGSYTAQIPQANEEYIRPSLAFDLGVRFNLDIKN